jgi:hypothetical protein
MHKKQAVINWLRNNGDYDPEKSTGVFKNLFEVQVFENIVKKYLNLGSEHRGSYEYHRVNDVRWTYEPQFKLTFQENDFQYFTSQRPSYGEESAIVDFLKFYRELE